MAVNQAEGWNELNISSEADAFKLIEKALQRQIGDQPCKLNFENWPILTIKLEGEGYNSTITPDMAEALVTLQHTMNRSYARLVHDLGDARRLSHEERDELKFKAKVAPGSSLIEINLGEWAQKIGLALTDKMTPEQLILTVLGAAAIAGTTFAYKAFLRARSEDKKVDAETAARVQLSQEETKRLEHITQLVGVIPKMKYTVEDFDDARVGLLKGVGDANSLTVSGVQLDRAEANTIARSKRSESTDIQANGQYRIVEVGWQQENEVRLKLASADGAREFGASFRDDSLEHGQIALLKDAEWSRETVYLSINATELRGQITTAVVVGVGAAQ